MGIKSLLTGTPWWVWCVLGYLLFIGYKATLKRTAFIPSLLIAPSILFFLTMRSALGLDVFIYFIISFCVGSMVSKIFFVPDFLIIDRNKWLIQLQGSFVTLGLILVIFAAKYFFGFLKATNQELALSLRWLELLLSGLFSGVMWGRVGSIIRRFYKAS